MKTTTPFRRANLRKVRNIQWRKSTCSGLKFRVGEVTIKQRPVQVFETPGGGWLSAYEGQFI